MVYRGDGAGDLFYSRFEGSVFGDGPLNPSEPRSEGLATIRAKAVARKKLDSARKTQERAAQAEAAALIELEEAAELEERLQSLPKEDPYENDTVLIFRKQFKRGSRVYDYAAIRIGGLWFLTGPQQSGLSYTWPKLIEFAVIDNGLSDVSFMIASAWERVI
jgi:hypothetical protein